MNKPSSLALSDMMTALMMIFMFISVSVLAELEQEERTFTKELNEALNGEFSGDLLRWRAEITEDNIVRFKAPFEVGSTEIPNDFEDVLAEFCPRYIAVLTRDQFLNGIAEVKVEGHTSKGWNRQTSSEDAFINNIELSQQRAVNVLSFCYLLKEEGIATNRAWLETFFHANGLASSRPMFVRGEVSNALSRRVEFTVVSVID